MLQIETTVLPGNRIEIKAPELPVGMQARVYILLKDQNPTPRPFWDVLMGYPGKQLFRTAQEVDAYLQTERDSWDK